MDQPTQHRLNRILRQLETERTDGKTAERLYGEVLSPLLSADGYRVTDVSATDAGLDFEAFAVSDASPARLGIEVKHAAKTTAVGRAVVERAAANATTRGLDRLLLVTAGPLTQAATDFAASHAPLTVQVFDLDSLKSWVARAAAAKDALDDSRIELLFGRMCASFAKIISIDPDALEKIEWRDLERLLAELFEGLGFQATLTPPARDGGRDVIAACRFEGESKTFLIEAKHWKSKNIGRDVAEAFIQVVLRDRADGGLIVAPFGYSAPAREALAEVTRVPIRIGTKTKVQTLCKTYVQIRSGIWTSHKPLTEVVFEDTV